jgi:7-keto-8-aminopelargonate synthetase-like enzyme
MARAERFHISHTRKVEGALRYVSEACEAGVIMQTAGSPCGRTVQVDGAELLNFGSCSYMALHDRPELRDGARRALDQYGTQFHFSRAYLECPLYVELEAQLAQIAGRPVLVAPSTSLAHMSAMPVLVRDDDRIVVDQFAHASLHTAIQLVPNVPVEILRHNRMERLDALLTGWRDEPGLVWYVADGLYSMLGDYADFAALRALLDRHPKLRLYIDDAHSVSWAGQHGRGVALEHFAHDERVVVALSLNKAFSAAGGALALPSRTLYERIRRCGGPMLFSGPIQPPMLGAAVASAALHLSPVLPPLQASLAARLERARRAVEAHGVPLATTDLSPIFQVRCDSTRIALSTVDSLRQRGFYACPCVFPAVPMNRAGIRFTVTQLVSDADVEAFVPALAECLADSLQAARAASALHAPL